MLGSFLWSRNESQPGCYAAATNRNPPSPDCIKAGNEKAYKLYRQFLLDVPRMDVFIDGQKCIDNPTSLFMRLWGIFGFSLDNCTQTALAKWFEQGRKEYCKSDEEHLVDGGRQILEVYTQQGSITIKKPFRLVKVAADTTDLALVQLVVSYDRLTKCQDNAWYIEQQTDIASSAKIDWILIDK